MIHRAEYIWLDGEQPTQRLRSKTKILCGLDENPKAGDFPEWNYDGSSTYQSAGHNSDLFLKPVNVVKDPIRGHGNFLALCEVFDENGKPHATNARAKLRDVLDAGAAKEEPWVGFEQEYTLFKGGIPLGWPERGYPKPQGPYYCGVGSTQVFGRNFVEAHTQVCLEAGLMVYGTNAEVMPGQWEFQIGYRGIDGENPDPLNASDHLWLARWLLYRVGEDFGIEPSLDNKPIKGDWNGAGCHTNISTKAMRIQEVGLKAIEEAIRSLGDNHSSHIKVYGDKLEERLTGHHETCRIDQFRSGIADRGASIRIPRGVSALGYGYIEDRRPGANSNPYIVSERILRTICKL